MKYIKIFDTHDPDYLDYINSNDVILPNLSYCEDEDETHITNSIDYYTNQYFTFIALEDCTFTAYEIMGGLYYSLDNGLTWTVDNTGEFTITVTSGNKVNISKH